VSDARAGVGFEMKIVSGFADKNSLALIAFENVVGQATEQHLGPSPHDVAMSLSFS